MKELTISEIRALQIKILDAIVEFCDANNIRYFLCGGTLLGAVRHKGYIPWDDDIDIMMLRDDYQRLSAEFTHKDMTILEHTKFKDYVYPFIKVSDNHTLCTELKYTDKNSHLGVNIDIFPIDNIPNERRSRSRLISRIKLIRKCMRLKRLRFNRHRILKSIVHLIARIFLLPMSVSALCRSLTRVGCKYNNTNTDYKGIVVWGYGKREICRAELFSSSVKVDFEGKQYDAPVGYKEYLTNVYGDYMQLPPENKRSSGHKFKVFRR
ncbi:MAG: LicD family protein [Rikenellaceae bacterium]